MSNQPKYHGLLTESEYQRQMSDWARRRRNEEIAWRLISLVVLVVFAVLVLD
jgi:hypothetical protein